MLIENAHFTVFDVETTGLFPYAGDRICEIGALRIEANGATERRFQTLVDPGMPISAGAFAVNGITAAMLKGKPAIGEVLPDFMEFIKGSVLVAYNAGFDLGFLEAALGERNYLLLEYPVIDVLALARRVFPGLGRYSLMLVAGALGIDASGGHRAMADTIMTWGVFRKALDVLAGRGVKDIEDITALYAGRPSQAEEARSPTIELLEDAIRSNKKVAITYLSLWNDSLTERVITPKRIQKGYGKSYVVAHCHLRNDERLFRLDCILKAGLHG
ncbi:MAG: WYL domain-containing protein [Candidatus Omnitrophica bacterium]|nr:WYL domain-containing protein [Candidatus Omnitrophota bacterium]